MIKTFNCGVGFCLNCKKKNINKIKKIFPRNINHMKLVFFQMINKKLKLSGKIKW